MSQTGTSVIKLALGLFTSRFKKSGFGFGEVPDSLYFDGDMRGISTYYNYRRDNNLDDFLIDDITWNDLSMDDIYKRINQRRSSSGEQYLYYMLRSPAVTRDEYNKRKELIDIIENNPALRVKLQKILSRLGRRRAANTCEAFYPSEHSLKKLFLYLFIVFCLILSGICISFTSTAVVPFVLLLILIPVYHQFEVSRIESELATVNNSVAMVHAADKIKKISNSELDSKLVSLYKASERLKALSRIGGVSTTTMDEFASFFCSITLLDLIIFELLKNRLGKYHNEIFLIHEFLGRIDASISIASFRQSVHTYSEPEIDFSSAMYLKSEAMLHPLIEAAVPNSVNTRQSVLITGSNASGKSVFLKTIAINAILAQSTCTAVCDNYSATAFRIFSSMAITDDLFAGESYYIAEIKSLKRIADAIKSGMPMLCVIDEVLRGTNTVERIAASVELLADFERENALCFAATHDIELCALLEERYHMLHFEEAIVDGAVLFDYKLKQGPATSRNALKLLRIIGFDSKTVDNADERANNYILTGKW